MLRGLRGQHAGSFEAAHAFVRDRARFAVETLPAEERYDLVVVGGGISGLAAAWFYRRAAGAQARILVLDNHDDFGGHAKRNEFMLDGRLIIGYGGSQSIDSPNSWWSDVGKGLLRDLGVDVRRFETAFERDLYSSLGLSRGLFFAREAFGRDVLASGDPLIMSGNEVTRRLVECQAAARVRRRLADLGGRARRSCSASIQRRAIRSPAGPSTRSSNCSRPRAIATI